MRRSIGITVAVMMVATVFVPASVSAKSVSIPGGEYLTVVFPTREDCLVYFPLAVEPKFCRAGAVALNIGIQDVSMYVRGAYGPPIMFRGKKALWPLVDYHSQQIGGFFSDGTINFVEPKLLMVLPNQNTLKSATGTWRAEWVNAKRAQWECSKYWKDVCRWSNGFVDKLATVQWLWDGSVIRNARAFGPEVG